MRVRVCVCVRACVRVCACTVHVFRSTQCKDKPEDVNHAGKHSAQWCYVVVCNCVCVITCYPVCLINIHHLMPVSSNIRLVCSEFSCTKDKLAGSCFMLWLSHATPMEY